MVNEFSTIRSSTPLTLFYFSLPGYILDSQTKQSVIQGSVRFPTDLFYKQKK